MPPRPPRPPRPFRFIWRAAHLLLLLAGATALTLAALLFTNLPYRAYRHMATLPAQIPPPPPGRTPTHIFLLGGGGIPSESALLRIYYAAQQSAQNPSAPLLLALPAIQGPDTRAYLDELALRGVPAHRIAILPGDNTRAQACSLVETLARNTPQNTAPSPLTHPFVLIVTSPEHTRRVAAAIHRLSPRLPLCAAPAWITSLDPSPPAHLPPHTPPGILRYSIWNNLVYLIRALREALALAYYHLLRWA